ncbi:MAG: hypothetical protein IJV16_06865, partial [Lachnospiraceae bacterium]|nr:hypothetical protein [Lachnospiraceae bacterium]
MEKCRGRIEYALLSVLFILVFRSVSAYAATTGELYTAGATRQMETGKMETVSADRVLSSTAGSGDIESVYKASLNVQKEEVIAGYTNLGIANVTDHLNVRKEADEEAELVGKMTKNAACEIQEIDGP